MFKLLIRAVLKGVPLIVFPKLNVFLNRLLGYQVDYSARIYSSVVIRGEMEVYIGKDTFIGDMSTIVGGRSIVHIGDFCDISDRVSIVTGTHEIDIDGVRIAGKGLSKNVKVGNGVWIGYGAIILPGVTIGDKSIIAAGCVVNKDVAPYTVVAGNPMQVKRILIQENTITQRVEKLD